jgi:hypothetical protein
VSDEEHTGSCVICQRRTPTPEDGDACAVCRSRVAGQLRDIPALVDELRDPPGADPYALRAVDLYYPPGHDRAGEAVPLAVERLPAAAVAGKSNAPRVQGSREAPVPIRVDVVDLLGPADERTVHDVHGDQVGHLSAATILDGWCRLFAEERRESTPTPHVATQAAWLLDRLDELFKHPAVDEFAGELGDLWHVLRRAAGLTMPRPELVVGVPCKSVDCDLKTLWRLPGSDYVECASCGRLYTMDDYQAWVALVAAAARRKT